MLLAHIGEPCFVVKETFIPSVIFAVSSVDTMDH